MRADAKNLMYTINHNLNTGLDRAMLDRAEGFVAPSCPGARKPGTARGEGRAPLR